ncbi:MAG: HD domain-containing protein [Armatimonadetes bacterium]|nr:HD domain-containing protein [Armatimonadota bacterium]
MRFATHLPQLTAREVLSLVPFADDVRRAAGRQRSYLVGGAVRDAFLGRSCMDFDFILADPPRVAGAVARRVGGSLVRLHEAHRTYRVALRRGGVRFYLDFAAVAPGGLAADMRARDFTINALAAGPLGEHPRLRDPCGGRADLARGVVRMISREALVRDPVRIVRAYRFAATLGFRLDRRTRRACAGLTGLFPEVAAERLGAELLLTLGARAYETPLQAMAEDGVLAALIPEFAPTVGVEQGGVHEFDVAAHSVLTAVRLAQIISRPGAFFREHADRIARYVADETTRSGLVLATLLHDIGKPERRTWGGRRWRFFGHEEHGAELAEQAVSRLRLPRRVRRQVKDLVRSHMRILPFMQTDEPTLRARRRFMRDMAPHGIGAVLLALADRRALRVTPSFDDDEAAVCRLACLLAAGEGGPASRTEDLPVNGDDLLRLGFAPGPQFKTILEAVEVQWIAGNLVTRDEALAWVRARFSGR